MKQKTTIRIDDVCGNCDSSIVDSIVEESLKRDFTVMMCISLFYNSEGIVRGMPEDPELLPYSDPTRHYSVDRMMSFTNGTIKDWRDRKVRIVSHGLIHVDHRLISRGAQEMSIVVSCALLSTNYFLPPYHKWNPDTESVCKQHNIGLIKYEDGWLSAAYKPFIPGRKYYIHPNLYETTEGFVQWLEGRRNEY